MLLEHLALARREQAPALGELGFDSPLEHVRALRPLLMDDAHDEAMVARLGGRRVTAHGHGVLQLREVAADVRLHARPIGILCRDARQGLFGTPGDAERGIDAPRRLGEGGRRGHRGHRARYGRRGRRGQRERLDCPGRSRRRVRRRHRRRFEVLAERDGQQLGFAREGLERLDGCLARLHTLGEACFLSLAILLRLAAPAARDDELGARPLLRVLIPRERLFGLLDGAEQLLDLFADGVLERRDRLLGLAQRDALRL